MGGDGTSGTLPINGIIWERDWNFTFVFYWYQYDLLSLKYEANDLESKNNL